VGAEIGVEGRIEGDIALVVAEQVDLHFLCVRPAEIEAVQRVAVGRDRIRRRAMRVLSGNRLGSPPPDIDGILLPSLHLCKVRVM